MVSSVRNFKHQTCFLHELAQKEIIQPVPAVFLVLGYFVSSYCIFGILVYIRAWQPRLREGREPTSGSIERLE